MSETSKQIAEIQLKLSECRSAEKDLIKRASVLEELIISPRMKLKVMEINREWIETLIARNDIQIKLLGIISTELAKIKNLHTEKLRHSRPMTEDEILGAEDDAFDRRHGLDLED